MRRIVFYVAVRWWTPVPLEAKKLVKVLGMGRWRDLTNPERRE